MWKIIQPSLKTLISHSFNKKKKMSPGKLLQNWSHYIFIQSICVGFCACMWRWITNMFALFKLSSNKQQCHTQQLHSTTEVSVLGVQQYPSTSGIINESSGQENTLRSLDRWRQKRDANVKGSRQGSHPLKHVCFQWCDESATGTVFLQLKSEPSQLLQQMWCRGFEAAWCPCGYNS